MYEYPSNSFTFHYVSINTVAKARRKLFTVNFTFHYVSINTKNNTYQETSHPSLHSTMFLLILLVVSLITSPLADFTFHYVSINTFFLFVLFLPFVSLHSTMFLLIPSSIQTTAFTKLPLHSTMFLLIQTFFPPSLTF